MYITKHCKLCDHQEIDFKTGTFCGLTQRKPQFYGTCVNAKFENKLESEIISANIKYKEVLKTKRRTYFYFISLSILGTLSVMAGCYIGLFLFENWHYGHDYDRYLSYSSVILILGSILFIFPKGTNHLSNYKNNLRLSKKKKDELDTILNLYGIKYHIEIFFPKDNSDDNIEVDLKING